MRAYYPASAALQKIWSNITAGQGYCCYHKEFKVYLEASASRGDYILIQGDLGMVFSLVNWCLRRGMIPIYSTTKRTVMESIKKAAWSNLFTYLNM